MGKSKILILVIVIAILSISSGFFVLNFIFGRDEPFPDDIDLRLSKIDGAKDKNAFYHLENAVAKIYLPEEKLGIFNSMIKGEEWNMEVAEELIKNNQEVFNHLDDAFKSNQFLPPGWENPSVVTITTQMLSPANFVRVAKLNLIKAMYLFKKGSEKESFEETIKVIKIGQLMEGSRVLVFYLAGSNLKELGLNQLRTMIPAVSLSSETLQEYIDKLDEFKSNEEDLVGVLKMEYMVAINTKEKFIDKPYTASVQVFMEELDELGDELGIGIPFTARMMPRKYLYKPNQTQRFFAEHFRAMVDNAKKNYCNEKLSPEVESLIPTSKIKMIFTENLMGKILFETMAVDIEGLRSRKCLGDFSIEGTRILLALKAYHIGTGDIPNTLSELIPDYVSEIPKDPFSREPIKYSKGKRMFYSVGKDLKDSGGSEGEDWRAMEDPTIQIKF